MTVIRDKRTRWGNGIRENKTRDLYFSYYAEGEGSDLDALRETSVSQSLS